MLKQIIFSNEITLWWTKDEFDYADCYKLYLDGKAHGKTNKTHYSFLSLSAEQTYDIYIEAYKGKKLTNKQHLSLATAKEKNRIDVTKEPYNAVGDGKTMNTQAIQNALNDCRENDYVYFPAGTYLTGALDVHSDTELYFEQGSILQGSEDPNDYLPKIKSRFEGIERMCYRSLLNMGDLESNGGYNCKNVTIKGKGCIFGGGRPLALNTIANEKERFKTHPEEFPDDIAACECADTPFGRARGRLLNISNCENVILSGVDVGYGPAWNVHFIYSKDITTYGCIIRSNNWYDENGKIKNEHVWNGDGWDPDSSENCAIFDTEFVTGDDCVAIKSGKNPEGNIVNRPTKNVYIFDCKTNEGHSIAIGSEMSGGVENVYVWDCDLKNCNMGVQIKATRERGGYVRNVNVRDSQMKSIYVRAKVNYNNDGEPAKTLPVLENYNYENVELYGHEENGQIHYIYLEGYEENGHRLTNVNIKNVNLVGAKQGEGIYQDCVENINIEN